MPRPRTRRRSFAWGHGAWASLLVSLCLSLAWHHPLSGMLAVLASLGLIGVVAWRPLLGFIVLPAALPIIGLMPWTGWLTFEELDLAVLAVAAGGHVRMAWRRPLVPDGADPTEAGGSRATALKGLLLLAYAAVLLVSMQRGFEDAGGFSWGWWQGYHEPMNSLRLAKSFVLALLLLPLWRAVARTAPRRALHGLALGMMLGLLEVALLALWERWAFTDLANFSSDYRTTALFWEMHVGGAAFDGFLALTMPFAVHELVRPGSRLRWLLAAAAVLFGAYACLTTFSRAVYLAIPIGLALMAMLQALAARRQHPRGAVARDGTVPAALACALFALAVASVFPTSGYRGALALLGAVALLLPMAAWLRRSPAAGWAAGVAAGVVLALMLGLLSYVLPKGPYVTYLVAWAAGAGLLVGLRLAPPPASAVWPGALLLASFVAVLSSIPLVAIHWGGEPAWVPATAAAAGGLAAAWAGGRRARPLWPESLRWQGGLLGAMLVVTMLTGVLFGGAYMADRFATGERDIDGRVQHWGRALSLLDDPMAWAFGKGTGRYPANHFLSGLTADQSGDYRLRDQGGERHLVLAAGKHTQGWGDMFRVSQRVGAFDGPVTVHVDARSDEAVSLHFEICEKHLIYNGDCRVADLNIKPAPGQWQALEVPLAGGGLGHGDWFAPRLLVFSVAVSTSGRSVEFDNFRASTAGGSELIANGDFDAGMARWFFSSDRHHLPWHMKNMGLHVLFEQGWVGLLLSSALLVAGLWRVTVGRARDHELAPALAAALVGFMIVGLFDSLLDAPRVAFLFQWLLLVSLVMPPPSRTLPGASALPP